MNEPAVNGTIEAVDIVRCGLPLARPVHVGRTIYREREYVALRLRLAGGLYGEAIGYTRGLPLDAMLESLAPSLLGADASRRLAIMDELAATNSSAANAFVRAFSLIDICLWDVLARQAQRPLWRLLGGARDRVPLAMVCGYFAAERGPAAVDDEIRGHLEAGVRLLKLHSADVDVLTRVASLVGGRAGLAIDVGMAWRSLPEAIEACRRLDDLGLAFIEDPFPPERWRLTAELASHIRTPLAAGEDAAGPERLVDLLDGVAVLRLDATASGGFDAILGVAAIAAQRGRRVMTHAFPDLHAQLAGAAAVEMVEMIPDAAGANPVGQLLARRQRIEDGHLLLSEAPGHGAPLDWDAVVAHARRTINVEA